ncbi:MAG: hypothetical protein MUE73_10210, partial [Planctomycetes bacterium]|nr:hypothetical protein [Planctomycetota bacterium]
MTRSNALSEREQKSRAASLSAPARASRYRESRHRCAPRPTTLRAGHDALRIASSLVVFDRLRKVESSSLLALLAP